MAEAKEPFIQMWYFCVFCLCKCAVGDFIFLLNQSSSNMAYSCARTWFKSEINCTFGLNPDFGCLI